METGKLGTLESKLGGFKLAGIDTALPPPPPPLPAATSGKFILADVFVSVNGVELSHHAHAIGMETGGGEVEFTPLGSSYREYTRGAPEDLRVTISFWQDYAVGSVDDVIADAYENDETVSVTIRPNRTRANPFYTFEAQVENYGPLAGGTGDGASVEVVFRNADPAPFAGRVVNTV